MALLQSQIPWETQLGIIGELAIKYDWRISQTPQSMKRMRGLISTVN